jgi:hypothetical protein
MSAKVASMSSHSNTVEGFRSHVYCGGASCSSTGLPSDLEQNLFATRADLNLVPETRTGHSERADGRVEAVHV